MTFLPGQYWFYNELSIDDMYFQTETVEAIVNHILSLYTGKVAAYARDDKRLEIRLDKEAVDHAVYRRNEHIILWIQWSEATYHPWKNEHIILWIQRSGSAYHVMDSCTKAAWARPCGKPSCCA